MTVNTTTVYTESLCDGLTKTFPFYFKTFESDELLVELQVVDYSLPGVPVASAEYTIAGLGNDEGGSITFAIAPVLGYRVIISRHVPYTQETTVLNQSGFYPEEIERRFDLTTMQIQQLLSDLGRTLKVPFPETALTIPNKVTRAGKYLVFDGNGNPTTSFGTGADGGLRPDLAAPGGDNLIWFTDERTIGEAVTEDRQRVNVLRYIPFAQQARIQTGQAPTIDIEPYLQLAMNDCLVDRTGMTAGAYAGNNPSAIGQYGCKTLYFPKGKYPMEVGFAAIAQAFGISLVGDGAYQTVIEFHGDDIDVFTFNAYNHLLMQGITFRHVAQSADPLDWTGNFATLTGVGGGRQLKILDCAVLGFNHGILYPDGEIVNNDTIQVRGSDWFWQNKIMRGRNAQALINEWSTSTLYGHGNGFDLAGLGYFKLQSLNVVLNGYLLNIHGQAGLSGSSNQYEMDNVKQEPYAYLVPGGLSSSKIITCSGDLALCKASIALKNVGFTSGVSFDPASFQVELTPNMRIDWDGGNLKPSARIGTHPANRVNNATFNGAAGLYMKNMLETPPIGNVVRASASTGQQSYAPVVFEGNDITKSIFCGARSGETTSAPPDMGRARQRHALGDTTLRYCLLTAGAAKVQQVEFSGFIQSIDDLEIHVRDKAAAELVIELSFDNFATTTQTLYVPSGVASQPKVVRASDPYIGSKTFDWGSLADGAQQTTTVTVRGARVGDLAVPKMSIARSGTELWAEVTADDTVTVYQRNGTGAPVDLGSATLTAIVTPDPTRSIIGQRTSVGLYVRCSGPVTTGFIIPTYTGR